MKPKYWILLACIICAVGCGITAAALLDSGGHHKNLADFFTALAIVLIAPSMFIGASVLYDLES